MTKMINDLNHVLSQLGLTISNSSRKTTATTNAPQWHGHVLTTNIGDSPLQHNDARLDVLGTKLTMDGSMQPEIQHRRRKAFNAYWSQKPALKLKNASFKRRIALRAGPQLNNNARN